jgi:beta-carotene 3-hydroxylase
MINVLIAIAAFFFMEFIAWSNHKFVMHGFLWKWHADHHINDNKKNKTQTELYSQGFEKNDYFFLVYAIPAIVLLIVGFYFNIHAVIAVGIGISVYGLTYFIIHDVIIHQRLKIPFLMKIQNPYLKAIINAHLAHHRGKNIRDFNNYGLLIFQRRFLKE